MDYKGLIFPRRCPVCSGLLPFNGEMICRECKQKLVYVLEPRCKKCGKQLFKQEQEYCYDCRSKQHLYKEGLAGFCHVGEIKKSIYDIKYENKREYAEFYAKEMCKLHGRYILSWGCDGLIPVPLHFRKRIKRGYNQAKVIAKIFSKELGILMYDNVLKRIRYTEPQKELSDMQRRKNLENAFKITKNIVELKKVILVDDIYTTGSTIDACAGELLHCGVEEVYYLSLTIGTGY